VKVRVTVALLIAALAVYFVLLAGRAVALLQTGSLVGVLLGVGVLILPVLGVWLVYSNLRFGWETEKMARELDADGLLPDVSHLPRRPSGRVDRDAADEWFEERRAEVEAAPEDWRAWFRLAYAYDIAGDRGRARETMRKAIQLHS
jgi:hypothetical protein